MREDNRTFAELRADIRRLKATNAKLIKALERILTHRVKVYEGEIFVKTVARAALAKAKEAEDPS